MLPAAFGPRDVNMEIGKRHLLERVVDAEQRRMARWSTATDAYYGRMPDAIRTKPNKPNDNVKINYARLLVDKGASFLFGKDVTFEIDEDGETEEEKYLERVWKAARKMTFLHNVAVNGGIYGHAFIRIRRPREDDQNALPKLVNLDPMTVNVQWDDEDVDVVLRYTITYDIAGRGGKPRLRRIRIERAEDGQSWSEITEERDPDKLEWEQVGEPEDWPYPFPPIVHCQNLPCPNEFWGLADLEEDVLEVIKSINFVLSNMRKIVRYHGHPKTIGTGFNQKQMQVDSDEMIILPNENARIWNLEMINNLGAGLEYYRVLKDALHQTARMPEVAMGKLEGIGAVSGVALELLFQPLLDLTGSKRMLYGDMLSSLNARLLVMAGKAESEEAVEVKTVWPNPLPKDETAERANYQIDVTAFGVSQETVLERLGYDPKKERERKKNDAPPAAATPTSQATEQPARQPGAQQPVEPQTPPDGDKESQAQ